MSVWSIIAGSKMMKNSQYCVDVDNDEEEDEEDDRDKYVDTTNMYDDDERYDDEDDDDDDLEVINMDDKNNCPCLTNDNNIYTLEYQPVNNLDEFNSLNKTGYWEDSYGIVYIKYYNVLGELITTNFTKYRYAENFFHRNVLFDKHEKERRILTFIRDGKDDYTENSARLVYDRKGDSYYYYRFVLDSKNQILKFKTVIDAKNYFYDKYNIGLAYYE